MKKDWKFLLLILFGFSITYCQACRYTIREIGFSALSKVNYVIYRVDVDNSRQLDQEVKSLIKSNVNWRGLSLKNDTEHPVINYAKSKNLNLPAYILADINNNFLLIEETKPNTKLKEVLLYSKTQERLQKILPINYATVLLLESSDKNANEKAISNILKSCERITNIMPNMPKQVDVGPEITIIPKENFNDEKVLLWSLGINKIPDSPVAFILYGKGRIMGDVIKFQDIISDKLYKLLSIIGADCECGIDKKWMLGKQIPLDWQNKTRQDLANRLGFDVDNPMVLNEMSRILAIENRVPKDPDGISFEPEIIDLETVLNNVPEFQYEIEDEQTSKIDESHDYNIVWFSLAIFLFVIGLGYYVIIRKKR